MLADDGVGIKVVRSLTSQLAAQNDVVTLEFCAGGMRLMEALRGYQKAILIDAIVTPGGRPGRIYRFQPSDLRTTRNTCSTHDASLVEALELGRAVGLPLPEEIRIWAIEAGDVATFSEELTQPVRAAVPKVIQGVIRELDDDRGLRRPGETR